MLFVIAFNYEFLSVIYHCSLMTNSDEEDEDDVLLENFFLGLRVENNMSLIRSLREILCEIVEQDEDDHVHHSIVPLERAHIKIVEFQCSREKLMMLYNILGAFIEEIPQSEVTVKSLRMMGDNVVMVGVESEHLVRLHNDVKTVLLDNNISVDTSPFTPGITLLESEHKLNINSNIFGECLKQSEMKIHENSFRQVPEPSNWKTGGW